MVSWEKQVRCLQKQPLWPLSLQPGTPTFAHRQGQALLHTHRPRPWDSLGMPLSPQPWREEKGILHLSSLPSQSLALLVPPLSPCTLGPGTHCSQGC